MGLFDTVEFCGREYQTKWQKDGFDGYQYCVMERFRVGDRAHLGLEDGTYECSSDRDYAIVVHWGQVFVVRANRGGDDYDES